jgi:hypothetical protein
MNGIRLNVEGREITHRLMNHSHFNSLAGALFPVKEKQRRGDPHFAACGLAIRFR